MPYCRGDGYVDGQHKDHDLGHKEGDFPVSEKCARTSLAIPIYSEMHQDDLEYVCQTLREFYR